MPSRAEASSNPDGMLVESQNMGPSSAGREELTFRITTGLSIGGGQRQNC